MTGKNEKDDVKLFPDVPENAITREDADFAVGEYSPIPEPDEDHRRLYFFAPKYKGPGTEAYEKKKKELEDAERAAGGYDPTTYFMFMGL